MENTENTSDFANDINNIDLVQKLLNNEPNIENKKEEPKFDFSNLKAIIESNFKKNEEIIQNLLSEFQKIQEENNLFKENLYNIKNNISQFSNTINENIKNHIDAVNNIRSFVEKHSKTLLNIENIIKNQKPAAQTQENNTQTRESNIKNKETINESNENNQDINNLLNDTIKKIDDNAEKINKLEKELLKIQDQNIEISKINLFSKKHIDDKHYKFLNDIFEAIHIINKNIEKKLSNLKENKSKENEQSTEKKKEENSNLKEKKEDKSNKQKSDAYNKIFEYVVNKFKIHSNNITNISNKIDNFKTTFNIFSQNTSFSLRNVFGVVRSLFSGFFKTFLPSFFTMLTSFFTVVIPTAFSILATILLIGVMIFLLWKTIGGETFKKIFMFIWDSIKNLSVAFMKFMPTVMSFINLVFNLLNNIGNILNAIFTLNWAKFSQSLSNLVRDIISGVGDFFKKLWKFLVENPVWGTITVILTTLVANKIITELTLAAVKAGKFIDGIFKISKWFPLLKSIFSSIGLFLLPLLKTAFMFIIKTALPFIGKALVSALMAIPVVGWIIAAIVSIILLVTIFRKEIWNFLKKIWEWMRPAIDFISDIIQTISDIVVDWVIKQIKKIVSFIHKIWENIKDFGKQILETPTRIWNASKKYLNEYITQPIKNFFSFWKSSDEKEEKKEDTSSKSRTTAEVPSENVAKAVSSIPIPSSPSATPSQAVSQSTTPSFRNIVETGENATILSDIQLGQSNASTLLRQYVKENKIDSKKLKLLLGAFLDIFKERYGGYSINYGKVISASGEPVPNWLEKTLFYLSMAYEDAYQSESGHRFSFREFEHPVFKGMTFKQLLDNMVNFMNESIGIIEKKKEGAVQQPLTSPPVTSSAQPVSPQAASASVSIPTPPSYQTNTAAATSTQAVSQSTTPSFRNIVETGENAAILNDIQLGQSNVSTLLKQYVKENKIDPKKLKLLLGAFLDIFKERYGGYSINYGKVISASGEPVPSWLEKTLFYISMIYNDALNSESGYRFSFIEFNNPVFKGMTFKQLLDNMVNFMNESIGIIKKKKEGTVQQPPTPPPTTSSIQPVPPQAASASVPIPTPPSYQTNTASAQESTSPVPSSISQPISASTPTQTTPASINLSNIELGNKNAKQLKEVLSKLNIKKFIDFIEHFIGFVSSKYKSIQISMGQIVKTGTGEPVPDWLKPIYFNLVDIINYYEEEGNRGILMKVASVLENEKFKGMTLQSLIEKMSDFMKQSPPTLTKQETVPPKAVSATPPVNQTIVPQELSKEPQVERKPIIDQNKKPEISTTSIPLQSNQIIQEKTTNLESLKEETNKTVSYLPSTQTLVEQHENIVKEETQQLSNKLDDIKTYLQNSNNNIQDILTKINQAILGQTSSGGSSVDRNTDLLLLMSQKPFIHGRI